MVHTVLHVKAFKKETRSQPQTGLEAQTMFTNLEQERAAEFKVSAGGRARHPCRAYRQLTTALSS
jgi:hypothetical protein